MVQRRPADGGRTEAGSSLQEFPDQLKRPAGQPNSVGAAVNVAATKLLDLRHAMPDVFPRFRRWSIGARIAAVVLALALPLNLLIVAAIWQLAHVATETQRTALLYTARTVAAAVDAQLGRHIVLAQSLA